MEKVKQKFGDYQSYAKELWLLALPIIMGNLGNMLIGVGDVFVAAKHSTLTLAAISIATAIFMTLMIGGLGLLYSISPVVSHLRGQKLRTKNLFAVTVVYAMFLAMIFFVIIRIGALLVGYIGFDPVLVPMIKEYMMICSYSIFGAFLYNSLKEFLQAYEIVMLPNLIAIIGIFLNLVLCFMFVFGLWGAPEMGVKGLAWAAVVVRSFMGLWLLFVCLPFFRGSTNNVSKYLFDLLKIGWPMSIALCLEFSGFNISAILVGKISPLFAAAHNLIITCASVSFMIPLSISNAIAVKVAYSDGAGDFTLLKNYAYTGIVMILIYMSFSAFLFVTFPRQLIGLFTSDNLVLAVAVPVMFIVACFQIFDGLQVAFSGVLRGLKMTKPIMLNIFLAYWVIGIPFGAWLAFSKGIVLAGFWSGLAVALFVASLISGTIIKNKFKELR